MSSTGVLQYIQYGSNILHVTPYNQNYYGVYCITAFIMVQGRYVPIRYVPVRYVPVCYVLVRLITVRYIPIRYCARHGSGLLPRT
jgi:hypothetical protein